MLTALTANCTAAVELSRLQVPLKSQTVWATASVSFLVWSKTA